MGNRLILILLVSIGMFSSSFAQQWKLRRYELMAGVGTAHCFGEIGGSKNEKSLFGINDFDILSSRPSIYIGTRYKISQDISIKGHFNSGWLSGKDEGSRNEGRNFSFNTFLQEFAVMGEYNFIREESKYKSSASFNRRGMINNYTKMSVYITAGLGAIYFKPKLDGSFEDRPDYVEGYSNIALIFPAGIGVKRIISSNLSVGFELGGRYTTTDFLDGFKSVYSKGNDVYYFANLTVIYRVKTDRFGHPHLFK